MPAATAAVPTSASADVSVLALLRGVVPARRVTFSEALRIAELQANRLHEHFRLTAPVPSEIVTELPRITVEFDPDLPVSGSAYWDGGRWVITLNATERSLRHRFSLMHEFKHVVDHTTKGLLYGPTDDPRSQERAERAADYFAACVLMPKRWVKRLWGERVQLVGELAKRFGVSRQAMGYRLDQLGLTDRYARCDPLHMKRHQRTARGGP